MRMFRDFCQFFVCSSFPFGFEVGLLGFDCIDS